MEKILAALGKRVFLMSNMHEDEPIIFQTRWVVSYLRGPLTRSQIKTLMAANKMAQEPPGQTLQATALVHEADLRLVDVESGKNRLSGS